MMQMVSWCAKWFGMLVLVQLGMLHGKPRILCMTKQVGTLRCPRVLALDCLCTSASDLSWF